MGFECCHPAIQLLYFLSVLAAAVCFRQPVFLALSFICAFAYSVQRNGRRAVGWNLCLLPLAVLFALFYSAYHHFGVTVLGQNLIGNNMTMESFACGLAGGVQAAAVCMWLCCVFSVFTTDKVVYLFGRVWPRAALFLSVALRMGPRLRQQAGKISTARQAVGRGVRQGGFFRQCANGLKILSMLLTWLLDSAAGLSDAMRSRGCTLKGRTAFSLYRFDNRDRGLVTGIFFCLTVTMMAVLLGQTQMYFDPRLVMNPITPASYFFYAGYGILCLLPMIMETAGRIQFAYLRKRR